jgi:hypothetical protein
MWKLSFVRQVPQSAWPIWRPIFTAGSSFPWMRADAARSRRHVFRAGAHWNAGNSPREHAQFGWFSKGHREQRASVISVVPTLTCILPKKCANTAETAVRHRPKAPLSKSKQTAVYWRPPWRISYAFLMDKSDSWPQRYPTEKFALSLLTGASEPRYTMRNNENAHMGFRCVIREKRQPGLGTMDVYGSGITGLIRSLPPVTRKRMFAPHFH